MFRAAAKTDIGPKKKSNQDSCCIEMAETPYGDAALVVVCDGVGGLASGEVASSSVVNWITADWFEAMFAEDLKRFAASPDELMDTVQTQWSYGLDCMNSAIRDHGREQKSQSGTTFTAILLFGGHYIIGHVGDTRVYKFSEGRMDILTRDQTWVAQEVARGNIPPEKARHHPRRNVILQSVGTQSNLQPVFSRGDYSTGDTYMVCCDGFRNELFDDELIEAFGNLENATESTIQARCDSLIEMVLQRGEHDNITAACLCCQENPDVQNVTGGGSSKLASRSGDPL